MDLPDFLESLSIENLSANTVRTAMAQGYDTLEKIRNLTVTQWSDVGKGISSRVGEKRAEVLYQSLHRPDIQPILDNPSNWLFDEEPQSADATPATTNSSLTVSRDIRGKSILFTGGWTTPRKELEEFIKSKGAIPASSVNHNLDILVTDSWDSKSSKMKKALSLGKTIFTYEEFFS